ncbi:MAG: AMP-binding protein, partial [Parvibaculaceae bacterium]
MRKLGSSAGQRLESYADILDFSLTNPREFWSALWAFAGVKASVRGDRILVDEDKMPGARFFPDARLNYAQNLLIKDDDSPALIFRGENKVRRTMSWKQLNRSVARLHHAFAKAGLKPGDRVAAIVPNLPETIVAFLATISLGGVWSSCSPDFGERGILDRFGQIEPRFLVTCDGYYYNGRTIPLAAKIDAVLKQLPSVEETIIIDYIGTATDISRTLPRAVAYDDYITRRKSTAINFAQLPFDHPLYILYSSGTTGIPKCIVHRAGGILLKHLSELLLNSDVKPSDRLFYFTTCGWMMWNWLVSG